MPMGVTSNWCHLQGHHARRPPTTVPFGCRGWWLYTAQNLCQASGAASCRTIVQHTHAMLFTTTTCGSQQWIVVNSWISDCWYISLFYSDIKAAWSRLVAYPSWTTNDENQLHLRWLIKVGEVKSWSWTPEFCVYTIPSESSRAS